MASQSLSEEVNRVPFIDLSIKCKDRSFQAHRVLVCRKSDVLKAALVGNFQEAKTNELNFDEDDPESVERMLIFCYTDTYDDTPSPALLAKHADTVSDKVSPDASRMLVNVSVYALAEKYAIFILKTLAKSKFEAIVDQPKLPEGFVDVARNVVASIPSTDHALRDIVCNKLASWVYVTTKAPDLVTLLEEDGQLCLDVLRSLWKQETKTRQSLENTVQDQKHRISRLEDEVEELRKEIDEY